MRLLAARVGLALLEVTAIRWWALESETDFSVILIMCWSSSVVHVRMWTLLPASVSDSAVHTVRYIHQYIHPWRIMQGWPHILFVHTACELVNWYLNSPTTCNSLLAV